jgi:hypothetical protein
MLGDLRHGLGEFLRVRMLGDVFGLALLIGHRPFLYHPMRPDAAKASGSALSVGDVTGVAGLTRIVGYDPVPAKRLATGSERFIQHGTGWAGKQPDADGP